MRTLSHSFMIFQYCGIWRPVHWSPGWKTVVYDSYTNMMIFIIYTFTISEFIDLMGSFDDIQEFANGSFMLLSMIGACGKAANLLKKRGAIIELTNVLQNDMCRPRSAEEVQIQRECDRGARLNTLWYGALTGTAVVSITVRSFILDIPQRTLPFKAWLPYNYDASQIGFWLAYVHQLVAHAVGALVNIAFDTLVPGLLRQTCGQIKILKWRLHAIPKTIDVMKKSRWDEVDRENLKGNQILESDLLTECVRHHLEIFQFAKTLNDIFGPAVFLQYLVSSAVICVSIYQLSKMRLFSSEFTAIILYLACMLVQIFNFCFCGDEVTLQSLEICDAVYGMDWTSFSLRTKRSLLTIMVRSLRPITFTCVSVIRLSLESFNDLVKLSYSAYNVLQKSAD